MAKRTSAKKSSKLRNAADLPEKGAGARVVVLVGKEAFLRSQNLEVIRTALGSAHGEVDTLRFDGGEAEVADVLDECRSFGLMAAHKLVVVDQADQWVKEHARALVERYAQAPSEGATLVLRCEKWNSGKNLDESISSAGGFVDCSALDEATALRWATLRASKRHGVTLDPAAGRLLVDRLGADLGRIDTELAKLALGCGEGGAIESDAVRELVGATREEEVWGIQATVLRGDPEGALAELREILGVSRQPPTLVMWALLDLGRKLHGAARALESGVPAQSIGRELKIWPFEKAQAIVRAAQRMGPERAWALFQAVLSADASVKTGLGRDERWLERLAVRFASAAG
ncbi:MAG: DNA polymerase III subunit delta [Planctomycetota bacterium]